MKINFTNYLQSWNRHCYGVAKGPILTSNSKVIDTLNYTIQCCRVYLEAGGDEMGVN